jgi:pimeloyl-ACP methyl ester carboxylesterase
MGTDRFSSTEPDSRNSVPPDRDVENVPNAGLSRRDFITASSAGVAGATFAPMAVATGARAGTAGRGQWGRKPRPFTLREQGSFYVGGSIEFRDPNSTTVNDQRFVPGNIAVNHMYVQYQIPAGRRYRYPIVLMHGGGHTAKVFETTPDGREGWYTSFMRRGFSTYAVDAPNRGRSGYDPTQRYKVTLGLAEPNTLEPGNIYSQQAAWVAFRWGPSFGVPYPGTQFPLAFMDQYIAQSLPSYRDAAANTRIAADLVALLDRIGPSILLGWSTGGTNVRDAAIQRPNLVKGLIAIEGGASAPPGSEGVLTRIPTLHMVGDFMSQASNDALKAFAAHLNSLGGDVTAVVLPEHGIRGNGHTMMVERNNEAIADLIEDWILDHVRRVRGR